MNLHFYLIKLKWNLALNNNLKTIKFLDENLRENLFSLEFDEYFLGHTRKIET